MPEPPSPDWLSWAFWAQDHESIRDLAITIAALVGIPFVIWREWLHHRQTEAAWQQAEVARQQAATAQLRHEEQVKADRERRITDSFMRAVEQLGTDKLETRLGAIYTLERIARESPVDHWPIMETLTAYVRERAPSPEQAEKEAHEGAAEGAQEKPEYAGGQPRKRLPTDIQAVLTAIGRRHREHESEAHHLNLRLIYAREANLPGAHLEGATLSGAHLEGATLSGAHLEGANLVGAQLKLAGLEGAYLNSASLDGANLIQAWLTRTHLQGASLFTARMEGALLRGANLSGARYLASAYLRGARLEGADLRNTDLTQEQFDSAISDNATMVPAHIKRPGKPPGEDMPGEAAP